jgi:hypothetical protein
LRIALSRGQGIDRHFSYFVPRIPLWPGFFWIAFDHRKPESTIGLPPVYGAYESCSIWQTTGRFRIDMPFRVFTYLEKDANELLEVCFDWSASAVWLLILPGAV